jgi:hypothetical protein
MVLVILSGIKLLAQDTYVFFGSFNRDKETEENLCLSAGYHQR